MAGGTWPESAAVLFLRRKSVSICLPPPFLLQAFGEGGGAGGLAALSARLTQEELRQLFTDVAR